MSTHHLIAMRGQGNIERELSLLQNEVFRQTGALSSQALPPLIPLARVNSQPRTEIVDGIPQTRLGPVRTISIATGPRGIYLACHLEPFWESWSRSVENIGDGLPRELLPFGVGAFIASSDAIALHPNPEESSANPPSMAPGAHFPLPESLRDVKLRSVLIQLVQISFRSIQDPWSHVDWNVIWSRKLALRGQTTTT